MVFLECENPWIVEIGTEVGVSQDGVFAGQVFDFPGFGVQDVDGVVGAVGEDDLPVVQDLIRRATVLIGVVPRIILLWQNLIDNVVFVSEDSVLSVVPRLKKVGGSRLGLSFGQYAEPSVPQGSGMIILTQTRGSLMSRDLLVTVLRPMGDAHSP